MKFIITEDQSDKVLRPLLEKFGMVTLSKMTGLSPKQIISMTGLTGSKKDMLYLAKIIMDKDSTELKYCNYQIIPTKYSFDLVVFIPEPAPENVGRYMFDEGTRNIYRDVISMTLYKYGAGIFRGHNIEVHNTGKC